MLDVLSTIFMAMFLLSVTQTWQKKTVKELLSKEIKKQDLALTTILSDSAKKYVIKSILKRRFSIGIVYLGRNLMNTI